MSRGNTKRKHELYIAGANVCPLCLTAMAERDATLEHVPSKKIDGKGIHLTCKTCNNSAGSSLDKGAIIDATGHVRATVTRPDGLSISAVFKFAASPPRLVEDPAVDEKPLPPPSEPVNELNVQFTTPRGEAISASLLRSAYLAVVALLGYTPRKDDAYDPVRRQIRNPVPVRIPYHVQLTGNREAGIYAAVHGDRVFWLVGFSTAIGYKWVRLPCSSHDRAFYAAASLTTEVTLIPLTRRFVSFSRRLEYLGIPPTDSLEQWSPRILWLQQAEAADNNYRPRLRLVSLQRGQHGAADLLLDGRSVPYTLHILPDDKGDLAKWVFIVEGRIYTPENADIAWA